MREPPDGRGWSERLRWLGWVLAAACLLFLAQRLTRMDWSRLADLSWPALLAGLTGLTLVRLAVIALLCRCWGWVLAGVVGSGSGDWSLGTLFAVYARGAVAKYLPGNVMEFIARNLLGRRLGVDQATLALASLLEVALTFGTAVSLSLPFAAGILGPFLGGWAAPAWMNNGIPLLALPLVVLAGVMLVARRGGGGGVGLLAAAARAVTGHVLVFAVTGTMLAMALALVGAAVTPAALPLLISAHALAWWAGLITPGAPGGLGVLEAVLLMILGERFGPEVTLAAALLLRLAAIGGDWLAFALTGRLKALAACWRWP
ncbi:MAG: hypothetical protein HQL82_07800 [Magnetococcales bacterium]|nr:hypothetical protein [Magnetococcales bacterium]